MIRYKLREGSNIEPSFFLERVCPKIAELCGNAMALTLGPAILWGAFAQFGTGNERIMPDWLAHRVRDMYLTVVENDLAANVNPVVKVPLLVTGIEGEVFLDEIPEEVVQETGGNAEEEAGQQQQHLAGAAAQVAQQQHLAGAVAQQPSRTVAGFGDRSTREQLMALSSQVMQVRRAQDRLHDQYQQLQMQISRGFTTTNSNLRRIGANPVRRLAAVANENGNNNANAANVPAANVPVQNLAAALSPTPRDLFELWNEFTIGIGGRKPASQFTAVERGQNKHRFTRRKVVWETIDRMVRRGFTANVAIDRIYAHYGRELSVTRILNAMLKDRREKTIPVALQ